MNAEVSKPLRAVAEERLHGLDTLRAAAILWVMPFHLRAHFPEALRPYCRFGWMGVDLFFVLSGFLIGTQMLRPYLQGQTLSLRDFYVRRAYRILPAYFVVLALYVALPVWRESPGMQPAWQFATFTENFLIDYGRNQAFSHAWSLCVEEHFYLLLPLLTLLLMRRPAAWKTYAVLVGVLLLGIAARAFVLVHVLRPLGPDDDAFSHVLIEKLYYPTYARLDGLAAGVALALLRAFRPGAWLRLTRHGHLTMFAGIASASFGAWLAEDRFGSVTGRGAASDLFSYPLLALGFALLTASALSANGLLARVHIPGVKVLATLAFSLYLTHKEAVHVLMRVLPGAPDGTWAMMPVLLITCLTAAGALYLGVERPFLWLRQHRSSRRARTASPDLMARIDPAL